MNKGHILLEGGAEFGGMMSEPDRKALSLAGGPDVKVSIIPAAAAPDDNHKRAGQNGVRWFKHLGATRASALPLIDRTTAEDPQIISALRRSRLIYLLGGFTRHLAQSLSDSGAWKAIVSAYESGAVLAGSSAGAMVLCRYFFDHSSGRVLKGLGLIPTACILPHHDTFGYLWAHRLKRRLPEMLLIGIDEETGMLDDGPQGLWQVYGKGSITLYRHETTIRFGAGDRFRLSRL
ncbi:MAG: hypothetical protein C4530_00075 [Desulfobacteraceae bacterium]|nr:MAG: hypothetical protein C4530_00075 [Desulfobacteraceae bacterium]